ncbi:MAG: RNA methyltransferase [Alphaproteobacteria bacterium]|nr:RNA methyltransferase [Alphaproteobacteria bacterium]
MSGTDKTLLTGTEAGENTASPSLAIILVEPQMGENIGMASRAMLNCELTDLRLVRPRDGWPNQKARNAASGADVVIDAVRVFDTTAEAIADLSVVYAATARPRDMIKTVMTPRHGVVQLRAKAATGLSCGVIFGGERAGLHNDDVALADVVLQAPLNPGFRSLNLGHAVLMVCYEWFQDASDAPAEFLTEMDSRQATKAELGNFFTRLEAALEDSGFLHVEERRPIMVRNIRNIFQRAHLTEQELRTLHGIVSALVRQPHKR